MNITPTETQAVFTIPEYQIKSFCENKWMAYLDPIFHHLDIDLLKKTCTDYTIENSGTDFTDLNPTTRIEVRKQIEEIIENWYSNFLTLEGNWKFESRKQSTTDG